MKRAARPKRGHTPAPERLKGVTLHHTFATLDTNIELVTRLAEAAMKLARQGACCEFHYSQALGDLCATALEYGIDVLVRRGKLSIVAPTPPGGSGHH